MVVKGLAPVFLTSVEHPRWEMASTTISEISELVRNSNLWFRKGLRLVQAASPLGPWVAQGLIEIRLSGKG